LVAREQQIAGVDIGHLHLDVTWETIDRDLTTATRAPTAPAADIRA